LTGAPAPKSAAPVNRGVTATAVLTSAAILLFLISAAGGFVAARVIGAEPVPPPKSHGTSAPAEPAPTTFARRTGDASSVQGGQNATFSVDVPTDWSRFTGSGVGDNLPPSTLVEWVSPDGSQMLAVDHIADYFPTYDIAQYSKGLSSDRPSGTFTSVSTAQLTNGRDGVEMFYRTFDRGSRGNSEQISRTTFAQIFRWGTGLWAVSVTVPTDQETTAKAELYERMVPTFTITG
jgi:hypothetical protein